MKLGDHVTWMYVSRGGYGCLMPVDAKIVELHLKQATIELNKRPGETVRRRVALTSLRKKSAKPHGFVCRYCGCTLTNVSEVEPGSGVYNRFCHERDGDMCERAGS